MRRKTKYPVYVLSKGRYDQCLTAKILQNDDVPFRLVVEEQEAELYAQKHGEECLVVLPPEATGKGAIPVRNWIWENSISEGHERHWVLDDNIRIIRRVYDGKRIPCNPLAAFLAVEDFTDRYTNLGISGLNYQMFGLPWNMPALYLNVHVYSFMLIQNSLPYRWRGRYNADTDLCLQVLSGGHCTALINVFLADKVATMLMSGGNTASYQGDGRLKMARALERLWPGVVTTRRRFNRPQHHVKGNWRGFDTPLIRKPGVQIPESAVEYGMRIEPQAPIKSAQMRKILDSFNSQQP